MLKVESNCQIHMGQGTKKIPKVHVDKSVSVEKIKFITILSRKYNVKSRKKLSNSHGTRHKKNSKSTC